MIDAEPQISPDNTPASADAAPLAEAAGPSAPHRSATREVLDSTQTVLTALILAFIFRAFLVEAFIIPTGSMAESLLGAHGTFLCPACGWEFDYGPQTSPATPDAPFDPPSSVCCPNCLTAFALQPEFCAPKAGDRILVHKWPFVFGGPLGPRRWDVIVFRNPSDPNQNYIKRLIGLPNETVEILDGDIYIDGKIARKTPAAQSALWFVVFDQDHFPNPVPNVMVDTRPRWTADGPSAEGWSGLEARALRYPGLDDAPRGLEFNRSNSPLYSRDVYGYNGGDSGFEVNDLRILAELTLHAGDGECRWELAHRDCRFVARLSRGGSASLWMQPPPARRAVRTLPWLLGGAATLWLHALDSGELLCCARDLGALAYGRPFKVEFGHVDYRAYLKVDDRELLATSDPQYAPDVAALRRGEAAPPAQPRIVAAGLALELRHLRLDRDVCYTRTGATLRADADNAFQLHADEYFVLGDNSPRSHDGREWYGKGPHLRDHYRIGTVRADQIVGQAFFVYLPGLQPLDAQGRWRIPDLGRARFIR